MHGMFISAFLVQKRENKSKREKGERASCTALSYRSLARSFVRSLILALSLSLSFPLEARRMHFSFTRKANTARERRDARGAENKAAAAARPDRYRATLEPAQQPTTTPTATFESASCRLYGRWVATTCFCPRNFGVGC